jgi:phosphonate transport system ATP-binding protein
MFELNRANIAYGDQIALRDISLRIEAGERVALIGPSGAGKTTLLKTLHEQRPQDASFIHQHYALVPQLSAFHNVYMGRLDRYSVWKNLHNLVWPRRDTKAEIMPLLDTLGLTPFAFKRVGALSGGQQQRTAIARAMYRASDVMFADEPVSSVDPHQAGMVLELIMKSQPTVILSLHAVELALKFARRIIGLRLGSMAFDLPASQVSAAHLAQLYQPC